MSPWEAAAPHHSRSEPPVGVSIEEASHCGPLSLDLLCLSLVLLSEGGFQIHFWMIQTRLSALLSTRLLLFGVFTPPLSS